MTNPDLGAIEQKLGTPFDMPPAWRSWVSRFLLQVAVDAAASMPERFKAVELLLRIDGINKSSGGDGQPENTTTLSDAAEELAAVRAHLLPLRLASDDDTTEEIARRAVAEIVRLRRQVPEAQTPAE